MGGSESGRCGNKNWFGWKKRRGEEKFGRKMVGRGWDGREKGVGEGVERGWMGVEGREMVVGGGGCGWMDVDVDGCGCGLDFVKFRIVRLSTL